MGLLGLDTPVGPACNLGRRNQMRLNGTIEAFHTASIGYEALRRLDASKSRKIGRWFMRQHFYL
jgi:hypothetical protein